MAKPKNPKAEEPITSDITEVSGEAFKAAVEAARDKNTFGRPTCMTPEIVAAICIRMADGQTITSICRDVGMPNVRTVRRWKNEHKEFAELYKAAHDALVENWADELVDIADDSTNDFIERTKRDGSTELAFNPEAVQRAKLRVDVRKWLLSKLLQDRYGDKVVVGGNDGGPITIKFVE